ncbi:MAG: hypothetical protein H6976_16615 [Gammaproteobacteria bacterium]|nr:hypothetical protein [Gammaproteobacteria bacterium]
MTTQHPVIISLNSAIDEAHDQLKRIRTSDSGFEYTNVATQELANSVKEYAEAIHAETLSVMKQDSSQVVTDAHVRRARSRIKKKEESSTSKITSTVGGLVGGTGASTFIGALSAATLSVPLLATGFVLTIVGVGVMVWGLSRE